MNFPTIPYFAKGTFFKIPIIGDCMLYVPAQLHPEPRKLHEDIQLFVINQTISASHNARKEEEKVSSIQDLVDLWLKDKNPEE